MKIVRKKGYNYLKHSYREDGKIITREIYLGKEVPKGIEKIKEELKKESKNLLYGKLEKVKKGFQKEWSRLPLTAKRKELDEISIAFTYNTNAIEGSTITLEETREIVEDKVAPNKPLRDIKETEAHYRVFLEMLNKKEKMTNGLLKHWHKEIFNDTKPEEAGRFREWLVRVGPYIAPDWQDVNSLMNEFIKPANRGNMNPVELAARAHYQFEKIHPFGDGNGRIGRLLMNYILWHSKYPMLIIEYKKRKPYYKAFMGDEERFVNYFIRRYLSTHKRFVEKHNA